MKDPYVHDNDTRPRVVGLDLHPDSLSAAVLAGQIPRTAKVVATYDHVAIDDCEDFLQNNTRENDIIVVEASSTSFSFEELACSLQRKVIVLNSIDAAKIGKCYRKTDMIDAHLLASVGTLAAGMAHEIKNPLVAISTFSQLLPEQYDDPEFRDSFTELVNAAVNRIDKLVNDVLKFGQPSKPVFVQIPLHEQLQRLLLLVKLELRKKEISLVCNLAADNDLVRADPDQIHQAALNLVLNAIDAMEPGGCLRLTTETATCEDGRDGICVQVSDSGPGIPEETVASIFDPFYTTKPEGTGLGLAITHGIVTEHGGKITVESPPNQGATFHITLPTDE